MSQMHISEEGVVTPELDEMEAAGGGTATA